MNAVSHWVESPLLCAEEDEIFEADSSKPNPVPSIVANSATDASDDHSDRDLYYGDEPDFDCENQAANPLNLIQCYAERSFPRAQMLDFSGRVDLPSAAVHGKIRERGAFVSSVVPEELRGDFILRLRRQLQELERQDTAVSAALSDSSELSTLPLESLRQSLTLLSNPAGNTGDSAVKANADVERPSSNPAESDVSLERRVAKLEKHLAACNFSGGEALWTVAESARLRLQSTDPSFWSEVRAALDSASSKFESTAPLAKGVDLCELLHRLRAIEVDACSIPVLVARLKSLKHSFDDASCAAAKTGALAQRYETLLSMKNENDTILAQLRTSLEENAATTTRNMASLEIRLNKALSLNPDIA